MRKMQDLPLPMLPHQTNVFHTYLPAEMPHVQQRIRDFRRIRKTECQRLHGKRARTKKEEESLGALMGIIYSP